MSELGDAVRAAKETGDLEPLWAEIPYARHLAIRVDLVDGALVSTMQPGDGHVGDPTLPALHGGTLGALLESAAIYQVVWDARTLVLPKTINITVSFLRSAKPVPTYARATVTRLGRRVATVQVEAWQDDEQKLVASAVAHFLVEPVGS